MDANKTKTFVNKKWRGEVIPKLQEYIEIPNVSPDYDPECFTNGHQERAMQLLSDFVAAQNIKGLTQEVITKPGRTPLLFIEVKATDESIDEQVGTVLLYGHMDKQPPFEGWMEGLDPYKGIIRGDRLYGRGGADDGYSTFCAVTSIKALQEQGTAHGRCVIIIEASEESGSPDLSLYVKELAEDGRIGSPNLIVCLDSGCGNYEQLWVTSSLRGVMMGTLTVEILEEGVHSGDASGVVPDTFRIARNLLDRIEDSKTGEITLKELYADISEQRIQQVRDAAAILGDEGMISCFPFLEGAESVDNKHVDELAFNRWWRPQLAVVGASGLPDAATAGNVLRPSTSLKLSIRLPPTVDCEAAERAVSKVLCENPPYGAKVTFHGGGAGPGWAAPDMSPWLEEAVQKASKQIFNKPAMFFGEGGSIPFMGMLGEIFPRAQFLVTGLIGPGANAHGPNEFLHIPFSENLTCCIAGVLADHCGARVENYLNNSAVASVSTPAEETKSLCANCQVTTLTENGAQYCNDVCRVSSVIHEFNEKRAASKQGSKPTRSTPPTVNDAETTISLAMERPKSTSSKGSAAVAAARGPIKSIRDKIKEKTSRRSTKEINEGVASVPVIPVTDVTTTAPSTTSAKATGEAPATKAKVTTTTAGSKKTSTSKSAAGANKTGTRQAAGNRRQVSPSAAQRQQRARGNNKKDSKNNNDCAIQ